MLQTEQIVQSLEGENMTRGKMLTKTKVKLDPLQFISKFESQIPQLEKKGYWYFSKNSNFPGAYIKETIPKLLIWITFTLWPVYANRPCTAFSLSFGEFIANSGHFSPVDWAKLPKDLMSN